MPATLNPQGSTPSLDRSSSSSTATPDSAFSSDSRVGPSKGEISLRFVDPSSDWPALAEARLRAFEGTALDGRFAPVERRPSLAERVGKC